MTSKERHQNRYIRRRTQRIEKRIKANKPYDRYENLLNADIYLDAYRKSRRGVSWKHSIQYYEMFLIKNIYDLVENLKTNKPVTRGFVNFKVNERGKIRDIKSPHICERVVHKGLVQECLLPILKRVLIYDNGACIKGKGVGFARSRISLHLRQFYKEYGRKGWVLTYDFSKYFDSVNHDILFKMLEEQVKDERLLDLIKFYTNENGNIGLGLGSEIFQILAVFFPNKIDHYIKDKKRMKYYGRYMDDGYIISNSKEELQQLLKDLQFMCDKLKLKLNTKKTKIEPLSHGLNFLHCRYKLSPTGKVLKFGGRECVKRERRRLKEFRRKLDNGQLTKKQISLFYKSWRKSFKRFFDSRLLLKNTDDLYNKLFL